MNMELLHYMETGMTSLKWFISYAFTQVLGLEDNGSMQCNHISASSDKGQTQSKDSKEEGIAQIIVSKENSANGFEMPLHYPRYTKEDYEKMEDWKLDMVLKEYGLAVKGALDAKRSFAIGTFVWPN
ncbi:hypothetical protein SO802_014364 [Lithocarpus litseifolius]|uniref:DUF7722 domain-containing protein n=1 Tax=Lithocarpus litseifolius TaxID=425828 RepID=A0AAW2CST7_9ROSI